MIKDKEQLDHIIKKLEEGFTGRQIHTELKEQFGYTNTEKTLSNLLPHIKRTNKNKNSISNDIDIIIEKQRRRIQNLMDQVRINNKIIRQYSRNTNTAENLLNEVLEKLNNTIFDFIPQCITRRKIDKSAIISLSDVHFSENILSSDTLDHNYYNYDVAGKRLQKYAYKIKKFLGNSVSDITVVFLGDLINSDRRLDELLSNSGCAAESLIKAIQHLGKFICDLGINYNINVVSVMGNESRLDRDVPMRDPINNYDFLIHKLLSELLDAQDLDHIQFANIERNYEKVINILGANILLTHGHNKLTWNDAVNKYNKIGKILNYMITGHFHTIKITDNSSQSGALSGGNFYGAFGVNDIVDATQTMYIVEKEYKSRPATISPIIINLQNVDEYSGYKTQNDVTEMK